MSSRANGTLNRVLIGFIAALFILATLYVARAFIPVFVLSVFLYYATRPIYRFIRRLHVPKRIAAVVSMLIFSLPFMVLTVYAFLLVIAEISDFVEEYDTEQELINELLAVNNLDELDEIIDMDAETIQEVAMTLYEDIDLIGIAANVVSDVTSIIISTMILLITTYLMLVHGPRFTAWLKNELNCNGVFSEFVTVTDRELSQTLFGNVVNVFATAIIAITVFMLYNVLTTASPSIPYPAVLGAFAGIGSLIPLIGIKIVYFPLTAYLVSASVLTEASVSAYFSIGALFVISLVIIDFIPDTFIRAYISGDLVNTPLLVIAYIIGPTVLGFYGLFAAPILLVCFITSIQILVPYVLHGDSTDTRQTSFDEY